MESESLYQDVPPAAPVEKATVVEDFVDVFYAPSKVFERRRDGRFGAALALLVVLVAALFFATRSAMEPVYDATMEQQIQAALRDNPDMPPQAISAMRSMGGIMMVGGALISTPLVVLGGALLLFFIARLFDLRPTFSQAAMIATFANVPRFILGSVVAAVQAFIFANPERAPTLYQLAISPARFLEPDANARLVAVLMRVELFTLWATVLLGIGLAVVCRTDKKKGMIAAFLVWGVATLLTAAFGGGR